MLYSKSKLYILDIRNKISKNKGLHGKKANAKNYIAIFQLFFLDLLLVLRGGSMS